MIRISLDHLDDLRIGIYRSLKATNETRDLGQFVVEGERLVERLLVSRFPIVSVLMTDRHESKLQVQIPDDTPVYVLAHELVDQLVGFPFHRGVLACGERRPWPVLGELVQATSGRTLTMVVCPRLSNPENLGAIARIGDVFGIDAILSGPSCPDPLSRRVLRVSMGAVLSLPVLVLDDLGAQVDRLARIDQVQILGAVADAAAKPFDSIRRPRRLALVLGDEHSGIEPEWLARCDRRVTIPIRKPGGSLNVAVAAGILIHSLTRSESGTRGDDSVPRL